MSFKSNGITYSVQQQGTKWILQGERENGTKLVLGTFLSKQDAENALKVRKDAHSAKSRYQTGTDTA